MTRSKEYVKADAFKRFIMREIKYGSLHHMHHKALLKLQLDLFKAGETELCEPPPKFAKELHHDRHF